MNSENDFSYVLQLLRQVPLPPQGELIQGADEAQVAAIAEKYDQPLPHAYVQWLHVCNGSFAGPGGIYGVRSLMGGPDALEILSLHPEWVERGWIPVAGDGTGNNYVMDASRQHLDSDAVYFVDAMGNDGLTYIVASGLTAFLKFLLERELGDKRWPFDASYVVSADPGISRVNDVNLLPWFS